MIPHPLMAASISHGSTMTILDDSIELGLLVVIVVTVVTVILLDRVGPIDILWLFV
jgi:hypothetical protein